MSLFDGTHIEVVVKATGNKQVVPTHWLDDPMLGAPFELPPSARAKGEQAAAPADPPAAPEGDTPETPAAAPASDKNPGRRG